MGTTRDDFSEGVKRTLSNRVGGICSNPACRIPTKGPHTENIKHINIGVASHISAASEGGPRYDQNMSSEERSSIENGIWLCSNCAKLIDSDTQKYTIELLKLWKQEAENKASGIIDRTSNFKSNTNLKIPINLMNKLVTSVRSLREGAIYFNSRSDSRVAQHSEEDIVVYNRCIDVRNCYIYIYSAVKNYGIQIRSICDIDSIIESRPVFCNVNDGNESIQIMYTISSFDFFFDEPYFSVFISNCDSIIKALENIYN